MKWLLLVVAFAACSTDTSSAGGDPGDWTAELEPSDETSSACVCEVAE